MFKGSRDALPTTDTIVEETARYYSLTPEELKSQSRTRDTALARQIAMYLIRKLTNLSLKETGLIFGRDHTTVINAERKIISLLKSPQIKGSPDYSSVVKDITSNINSKN